ncbi:hypothetical protein AAG906_012125 [Vitis piasezkii]
MVRISKIFRSIKRSNPNPNPNPDPSKSSPSSSRSKSSFSWLVYLILSTNTPIKTYVGVTTNFSRRLKQHNGELKGGAKASRTGRPWFESKWKSFSRKLPRKRNDTVRQVDNDSLLLLQHRQAALNRVKGSLVCDHLEINWQLNPS